MICSDPVILNGEIPALSQRQYVEHGARGFWAYDVALGVFLKYLVDAAQASNQADAAWLSTSIAWWRVVACISDYGLTLDVDWSDAQRQTFIALAEHACSSLAKRAAIPAEEISGWPLLDDVENFTRGETAVSTAPIVELGRAIIALVSGNLPDAPEGTAWFYGTPTGRRTLDCATPETTAEPFSG